MAESSTLRDLQMALLSGAAAGLCTDLALFPVDTVKTRLQSAAGLQGAGGLRGVYSGFAAVAAGSMPGAALFFCTYEGVKRLLGAGAGGRTRAVVVQMGAAAAGEVVACLVRVPCEVVKQRAQTGGGQTSRHVLTATLRQAGLRGLYQGYVSTVLREIPFALIQFPLWELLKWHWGGGQEVAGWQSAACGAGAGAVAAALTTPMDVAKTRIMLADRHSRLGAGNLIHALRLIWAENGVAGLFAGLTPRVTMIAVGGAIFLGIYDQVRLTLARLQHSARRSQGGD